MKEFEIVCPLTREPRLKEIEAKAVKLIEKPLMKHYDSMPRDNRL